MEYYKKIQWILRIGTFGTFIGHGILAIGVNPRWIIYLTTIGFTVDLATKIMPVIGVIDVLVAFTILIKPVRPVVMYAFIWAFLTATIRPVSGESILAFVERSANWAAPLALFILLSKKNATGE